MEIVSLLCLIVTGVMLLVLLKKLKQTLLGFEKRLVQVESYIVKGGEINE